MRAYELLKSVDNKTEYITSLILEAENVGPVANSNGPYEITRSDLKAVIIEAIRENPGIMAGIHISSQDKGVPFGSGSEDKKYHESPEETTRDIEANFDGAETAGNNGQRDVGLNEFDVKIDKATLEAIEDLKVFGFSPDEDDE